MQLGNKRGPSANRKFRFAEVTPGQDADRPANGGRRVWCRRAGDHSRVFTAATFPSTCCATTAASRAMAVTRFISRKPPGATDWKARPFASRPTACSIATASVHRLLGVEPLPGRRGIRRGKVYLNDPASGRRTIGFDEFERGYSGIAFTFEPGPHFVKEGKRPSAVAGSGPAAVDLQDRARLRDSGRVGAGDPQPGLGRVSAGLHRRDPDPGAPHLAQAAASGPWR